MQMGLNLLWPTTTKVGQKTRGHVQVIVHVAEGTYVYRSLCHFLIGMVEEWARVEQGACAGHKNARYLKPEIRERKPE